MGLFSMAKIFVFLFSIGWLVPDHYPPWLSFHSDVYFAFIFSIFLALYLYNNNEKFVSFELPFCALILIAAYVVLINSQIHNLYTTDLFFPAAYIIFFALSVAVPSWLRNSSTKTSPARIISNAAIVASILSVYLQLRVWLEVDPFGLAIYYSSGGQGSRPYGNIGQPNLLATLLLWGLLGLIWLKKTKDIGIVTLSSAIAFLLLGIALTQSRTALLGLIIITIVAGLYAVRDRGWDIFFYLLVASFGLLSLKYTMPHIDVWLLGREIELRELSVDNARLKIWQLAIEGIFHSPFLGWGLRDIHPLVLQYGDSSTSLGVTISKTHNIVLDLLVWFGIPLALLIIFIFIIWLVKIVVLVRRVDHLIPLLALLVLVVHSMLEFPHQYLFFIIPTGIFIGSLSLLIEWRPLLLIRKSFVIISLIISAGATVVVGSQYLKIEEEFRTWRFHNVNIGLNNTAPDITSPLFDKYAEFLRMDRLQPLDDGSFSENELGNLIRAINARPTQGIVLKLIMHYKATQEYQLVDKWLRSLCAISTQEQCIEYQELAFRD